jgi:hypothetical protein
LMTVVVSRNLRIHPSASMSVSAFWIAFDWTRDGFGVLATKKDLTLMHGEGKGKSLTS